MIDRKADLELVRRLHDEKAGLDEVDQVRHCISGLEEKLKHMSVLQAEIAMSLLPAKTSGTFQNVTDLNNSIKAREKLLGHAKLLCKWMYKKPRLHGEGQRMRSVTNRAKDSWRKSDELAFTKDSIDYLSNTSQNSP